MINLRKIDKLRLKLAGFICVVILAITLLILPSDFFDDGQSICLSVLLLDTECYACGITRATQHLIHREFEQAYEYNVIVFLVFPLIVFLLINEFVKFIKEYKEHRKERN